MAWRNKKKKIEGNFGKFRRNDIGCGIRPGFSMGMYNKLNKNFHAFIKDFNETGIDHVVWKFFDESDLSSMVHVTRKLNDQIDEFKTETVLDSRLGVYQKDRVCGTCCQTVSTCQGHYGYIKLPYPIINPIFERNIKQLLQAVCHSCGELIAKRFKLKGRNPYDRLIEASTIGKTVRECASCGYTNPIISQPKEVRTMTISDDESKRKMVRDELKSMPFNAKVTVLDSTDDVISLERTRNIFSRITDSAKEKLHFSKDNKLESMIMTFLIVTPSQTRPLVYTGNIEENNQFTEMYDQILKIIIKIEADSEYNVKNNNYLINLVRRLISENEPPIKTLGLFKSLADTLKKKSGLFRQCGMGKRINYGSRTVLSPAAETCVGEISYPMDAVLNMTVPEYVTEYNYDEIIKEWNNGNVKEIIPQDVSHPQYKNVISGKTKPFIGDLVNRQITNGDMILFNRQPTLNKYSMLAVQVAKHERNTKVHGINSCATKPANADFDGDEGNCYILQTLNSQIEGKHITNIRKNIIGGDGSTPIVSIQYHGIIGLYILTDDIIIQNDIWDEVFYRFWKGKESFIPLGVHGYKKYDESRYTGLQNDILDFEKRLSESNIPRYSGKALFSSILPRDLYYKKGEVLIVNGIMVKGRLTKKDVSGSLKGLTHTIYNDYGEEWCSDFLSNAQKMADWANSKFPISIGISDLLYVPNGELLNYVKESGVFDKVDIDTLNNIWKAYHGQSVDDEYEKFVSIFRSDLDKNKVLFELDSEVFKYPIKEIIDKSVKKIQNSINQLPREDSNMDAYEKQERELRVFNIIGRQDNETKKLGKDALRYDIFNNINPLILIQESGAKGSESNIMQLSITIGQVTVYGERISYMYAPTINNPEGSKTSIFYPSKEDDDYLDTVQSKGYIKNSYTSGLDPAEFMYNMRAERVGIIKSRINTAVSGYFSRKIMNFNDGIKIGGNGSILSSNDSMISPMYSHIFDTTRSISVKTKTQGLLYLPFDLEDLSRKASKMF